MVENSSQCILPLSNLLAFGPKYGQMILPSVANEAYKNVFAKHHLRLTPSYLEEINRHLQKEITEKCRNFNIIVENVSLEIGS